MNKPGVFNLHYSVRIQAAFVKAFIIDWLLGIDTCGEVEIGQDRDRSLNRDMTKYQPVFYGALSQLFRYLSPGAGDVFIDLGCGKGRVISVAARYGIRKVIGVEIDDALFSIAARNRDSLRGRRSPIELRHQDAARHVFTDENVVFFFNPFGQKTMEMVLANLKSSLDVFPRQIRVVQYGPAWDVLMNSQSWLRFEKKVGKSSVWSNRPLC